MKLSFKVGEKLVYPNHGVTVVEQIGESPIMGRVTATITSGCSRITRV